MGAKSIGELNKLITIESREEVDDGAGGFEEVWNTFANAWAKMRPVSARERFFGEKLDHNVTHVVTIRHIPGLKAEMRIVFDGRHLHVRGFRYEDESTHFIEIMAEEGAKS